MQQTHYVRVQVYK